MVNKKCREARGEQAMQVMHCVVVPEACMVLLTGVIPIHSIKKETIKVQGRALIMKKAISSSETEGQKDSMKREGHCEG